MAGRCDGRGSSGGCRGISGAVVDDPPHTHARAGAMRLGPEGCQPPINGLGWHALIGASLSMKGPRGQESYEGSHGLRQGMAVNECAIQHVSQMLVEHTSSEC